VSSIPDLIAKPTHILNEPSHTVRLVIAVLLPAGILGAVFYDSLAYMTDLWIHDENYSHGMLVPLVSFYLMWQRRRIIAETTRGGFWWSIVWILAGMALYVIGELATVYLLLHLALWCILIGLLVSALGSRAVSLMAFPLGYLLTAIPLPQFLYQGLSAKLQLISSALGVGCLQFIGITAFRDGNVIDLGPIQLQVVDACSGLRYLFPLATLALLCSYLFQDRMWKRMVLFASSIPISILLNGFRIGMIGVLVEYFGQSAADGFYHLFEGWVLFIASLGLLFAEMYALRRIGPSSDDRVVQVRPRSQPLEAVPISARLASPSYVYSVGLLALLPVIATQLVHRAEVAPTRQPFLDFPMQIKRWSGTAFPLEARYVEVLRFDDYLLADYVQPLTPPVNVYVAYYLSQRKGQSAHSPQTCIPGGGWEITSIDSVRVGSNEDSKPHRVVNRVHIQKADQHQLVLYWFKQRERFIANEYLVKLYVLWDAMTRQRTDGALIRLTTPIQQNEDDKVAEDRVLQFAQDLEPVLTAYVPD
jgi:exosortase D (VPLPA-CTERM-specific)